MTTNAVEIWDIAKITPYDKNAKIHSDKQVEDLARSIKEFGWTGPIVVDADGVVIAGHGRRLAALKLGYVKVPVIVRRDLTKAQANALRLADNKITSNDYDMSMIQAELQELAAMDFDISLAGFDENEITFTVDDIGAMDENFFVDDVGEAVEAQKERQAKAAEEADDTAAPLADAFGFKRVSIAHSRRIREFMDKIQAATGKKGIDALIAHIDAVS